MLIIGERINTSREAIARAVESRDADFIKNEALKQMEAGANMIDLNAGSFLPDDTPHLKWLVQTVQQAVDIPLSLDSPNPQAISAALEVHQGRALINSISGEKERFGSVIRLLRQYKCPVIALCLDDEGIPNNVEDRIKVAENLIERLNREGGLSPDDIYLDPIVSALSADWKSGKLVFELIERLKDLFPGIHIILGASNISFGLPLRRNINELFVVMAMAKGADALIMDPCVPGIISKLITAKTILGNDEYCLEYITAFREGKLY
jgi:5-methyltetrahydrofolate--homocysteine methyltransferase